MAAVFTVALFVLAFFVLLAVAYRLAQKAWRLFVGVTTFGLQLAFWLIMIACVGLLGSGVASLSGNEKPEEVGAVCVAIAGLICGMAFVIRRHSSRSRSMANVPPNLDAEAARLLTSAYDIFPSRRQKLRDFEVAWRGALKFASEDPLDNEARDVAIEIRRHAPKLIADTQSLLTDATGDEADRLRENLWASLSAVSDRANILAARLRSALQDGLEARHSRVRQSALG